VHRLDDLLGVATIPHGSAGHRNTTLQCRIADKAVGPQVLKQLLATDDLVAVLHQIRQYREHLAVEPHRHPGVAQFIELSVEHRIPEDI
jgi:hypothetical protein